MYTNDARHEKTDHPSFGMTPTFREYDLWSQKTQNAKKSVSYQKKDGHDLKVYFLVTHLK